MTLQEGDAVTIGNRRFTRAFNSLPQVFTTLRAPSLRRRFRLTVTRLPSGSARRLTNPSVIALGGDLIVLLREPNYVIDNRRRPRHRFDGDDLEATSTLWLAKSHPKLTEQDQVEDPVKLRFASTTEPTLADRLVDGRLFELSGRLWGIWSYYEPATPNGPRQSRVAIGSISDGRVEDLVRLESPYDRTEEKNWAPCVLGNRLQVMYDWSRLERYEIEGDRMRLVHRARSAIPQLEGHRGSSQLIRWRNRWIAVTHSTAVLGFWRLSTPHRWMTHSFVELDDAFELTRVSMPFVFESRGIEFCAGLAAVGDEFVLTYGVNDSSARKIVLSSSQVDSLLSAGA